MPLILGANSITGGFAVDNSLRFENGSSDYLNRSTSSGNQKTFTYSNWVKYSLNASDSAFFSSGALNNDLFFQFNSSSGTDERLQLFGRNGGIGQFELMTTQLFRDPSAWYHIVIAFDTTQATASNRIKLYVNGNQITSFDVTTYPSQNTDIHINESSGENFIGNGISVNYFSGYIAEAVLIDGQALDPTSFGEFDEDTGIWKPINVSGLTFGTNGFYLEFKDSSALGDDTSGNSNDFTVNNLTAIDQTTDTCTNNFATLNPIAFEGANFGGQLTEGNTQVGGAVSASNNLAMANFAVDTGKWYWEAKASASIDNYAYIGIRTYDSAPAKNQYVGEQTGGIALRSDGYLNIDGSFPSQFAGISYTSGDIIGIALDLDNNKIYWYENGSLVNTGGTAITNRLYAPASSIYSNTGEWKYNFGNPSFTISSGNSDGNGYGNFEYSVPSGYYALNTKNLAEYG
jgi:hypothetical protein